MPSNVLLLRLLQQYVVMFLPVPRSGCCLVKKAKEKNIDGTALAYVEMTLSCVRMP